MTFNDEYDQIIRRIEEAQKCRSKYTCCASPICAVGATGPTGPTGTAVANSLLTSNIADQTVTTTSLLNLGTEVNSTGTAITFTAPNTINLTPGSYLIQAFTLGTDATGTTGVGLELQVNSTGVPTATIEYVNGTGQNTLYVQHNLDVAANSTVTFANNTTGSVDYSGTSVSVIKIA